MKSRLKIASLSLLLLLFFLLIQIPAQLLARITEHYVPRLHMDGVTGSVWQGHVQILRWDNISLQGLSWQLSPWALLTAKAKLVLTLEDERIQGDVHVIITASGNIQSDHAQLNIAANSLASFAAIPGVQLQGKIALAVQQLQWQNQRLETLQSNLHWQSAGVQSVLGTTALGAYSSSISADNGGIAGVVHDDEGVLDLQANWHLDPQHYTVNGSVKHDLPESLARFFRMFAKDAGSRFEFTIDQAMP